MSILAPGTLVGKYPIARVLGTGGMGIIYEAVHPVLGARVVIKTIRPELAHDKSVVERFLREAQYTSRIRDDRLPQIYDHDRLGDGTPYIVMELLEGCDLADRVLDGPLSPAYAARIMVEVLEVLHKVHAHDIIHRDIKPQNIFLARSDLLGEVPKLLDFGVAHFAHDPATRPGEVMGTPLYMAIEQAEEGGRIGPWTDVFAAGVVLYECLAGRGVRPWGQGNALSYVSQLAAGVPARPLVDVVPGVPAGLSAAAMKALAVEPERRYPDALSFARALEPFAQPRSGLFDGRAAASARSRRASGPPTGLEETAWQLEPRTTPQPAEPTRRTLSGRAVRSLRARLAGLAPRDTSTTERLRAGERRHVTVLAVGLQLDADAARTLDAEDVDVVVDEVLSVFREALSQAGGRVDAPVGRTLLAGFGHERTREDDAERAVEAALALLARRSEVDAALAEIGYSVRLRLGLHAGFVTQLAEGTAAPLAGDTVEVARVLADNAPFNGVFASRELRDVVGHRFSWRRVGPVHLGGRARPVEAYEVLPGEETAGQRLERRGARLPLVGRVAEMAALEQVHAAAAAADGRVRMALLIGAPGSGKSRLLRAFCQRLETGAGDTVAVLRAQPLRRPYGLWVNLLQGLLFRGEERPRTRDAAMHLGLLAGDLDESGRATLLAQADVMEKLLGLGLHELDVREADRLRGSIRTLLALVLEAAGRRAERTLGRPLVVALDDLHDADEASARLLAELPELLRLRMPPLFVTATRRQRMPALSERIELTPVLLGELADDEVDAMVAGLAAGQRVSDAARALVRARAGGNPLFVEELVHALDDRRLLDADTPALEDVRVPDSLYGMLLARVDRLPADLRRAIRHLSVFGDHIDPRVWDEVQDGLAAEDDRTRPGDGEAARDELRALAERGLLDRVQTERGEVWRFHLQLLRSALYETVLTENKRLLHRLVARTIERLFDGQSADHEAELLYHYRHTDEVERVVYYARRVGRRALALGAHDEAVEALHRAASLQERLDERDASLEGGTLTELAWALFYSGRLDDALLRGRDALDRLAGPALPPASPAEAEHLERRAMAHLQVSCAATYLNDWDEAQAALEMAEHLFALAGRPEDAAAAQTTLGFVLRTMGRPAEGLGLARDGWQVLRRGQRRGPFVRACHDLGNILRDLGEHDEAIRVFDEGIAEAERHEARGDFVAAHWAVASLSGRALAYAATARLDEAVADQSRVYARLSAMRHPIGQAISAYHLACHLHDLTRYGEARRMAEVALSTAGAVQMPQRALKARLLLARIARAQGLTEERLEHLEAAEFIGRQLMARDPGAASLRAWLEVLGPLFEVLAEEGRRFRVEGLLAEVEAAAPPDDGELAAAVASLRARFASAAQATRPG